MPALTQSMFMDETVYLPPLIWAGVMGEEGSDPFGKKFPMGVQKDGWLIKWDQDQNPYGSTGQRSLEEAPALVQSPGVRVREVEPGLYADATELGEREILTSRQSGTFGKPLNVKERLAKMNLFLAERISNRILQTWADLGQTGLFNNVSAEGSVQHAYQLDNYQVIPVSAWLSNPAGATPIDDLRTAQAVLGRGTHSRFGNKSELLMTDEGINALLATAQIRNSFRSSYGASFLAPFDNAQLNGGQAPLNGEQSLNKLFFGMGLPEIVPWNRGRYPDLASAVARTRTSFQKFLSNTKAIWLGYRPNNQPIGEFTLAIHTGMQQTGPGEDWGVVGIKSPANEEWGEGIYFKVHYNNRIPEGYFIECGFNAVPRVFYEDAMACVTWS